jgi:non-canonical poly(A) RNA polymerase PAPD5/7
MDLVALSQEYVKNGQKRYCQNPRNMHALSAKLEYWQVAKRGTCAVIGRAKVPLVKFVDAKTNLRVDISFENDSGIRAIDTFLAWKEQYPQMPKLVVIIKQFLAMRGLNEVFSGGIGGFTIICLVTSMFQLMPETQGNGAELGYGELLLNFFDLYGNKFDVKEVGIMMNPPRYFSKGRDHVDAKINQTGLTIIDPNRPDNDISGGSREILKVLNAFRAAHAAIQRRLDSIRTGEVPTGSILGCILGGNYTSFQNQRNLLFSLQNDQTSARPSSPPGLPPPSFGWQSLNHPSLPPYPPPTYPPPTQQYQGYLQQQPQYGTPGSYPPQYQSSDPQRLQHPLPPPPPSGYAPNFAYGPAANGDWSYPSSIPLPERVPRSNR